jgi:hypothetical protein
VVQRPTTEGRARSVEPQQSEWIAQDRMSVGGREPEARGGGYGGLNWWRGFDDAVWAVERIQQLRLADRDLPGSDDHAPIPCHPLSPPSSILLLPPTSTTRSASSGKPIPPPIQVLWPVEAFASAATSFSPSVPDPLLLRHSSPTTQTLDYHEVSHYHRHGRNCL